jgi:hypothetical protein
VNKKNPTKFVTRAELEDLFMGRTPYWDNGEKVILVLLPLRSISTQELLNELNIPMYIYKRKLARLSKDSFGELPIYVDDTYDMLLVVGSEPRALSFVRSNTIILETDDIKLLQVTP